MSKYSEELAGQFPDIKNIRDATKTILQDGEELAFKEIHGANFENITRRIME